MKRGKMQVLVSFLAKEPSLKPKTHHREYTYIYLNQSVVDIPEAFQFALSKHISRIKSSSLTGSRFLSSCKRNKVFSGRFECLAEFVDAIQLRKTGKFDNVSAAFAFCV